MSYRCVVILSGKNKTYSNSRTQATLQIKNNSIVLTSSPETNGHRGRRGALGSGQLHSKVRPTKFTQRGENKPRGVNQKHKVIGASAAR